ncbi:MAG: AMP-binding protein [Clostridia bacterium]|nr:AMP-binding protein [Clostridia bacterium]
MLYSKTIGMLLETAKETWPDRLAASYCDETLTYQDLYNASSQMAKLLLGQGIRHGDHVGFLCAERPSTLVGLYACARIGAVCVLLNSAATTYELSAQLESTDTDFLLHGLGYGDLDFIQKAAELCARRPQLKALCIGETLADVAPLLKRGSAIMDSELTLAEKAVFPQDTMAILFTSGTTGACVPVMSSHFSRYNSALIQAKDLGASDDDRFLCALPYFHCFSLSANIFAAAAVGACLYFPTSRHSADLLHCLSANHCSILHGVPTLFLAMMLRPDFKTFDLSSLRIGLIGGSACLPDQLARIRTSFQYELLPSLGMTEATAGITVASTTDSENVKLFTVGHFMEHTEGVVKSPQTGQVLPIGQTGEICVRGYCVMQGYYRQPHKTQKVIDAEGFLHTGDLGYLDDSGNLHYVGRLKEIIIRSGENIFPGEIEACLQRDPRIREAQVIGLPDPVTGEAVCACVVSDDLLEAHDVQNIVAKRLSAYKVPRYVLFFSCLPRGSSGKVHLSLLRELALKELNLH